jgi:hypothetical protein
VNYANDGARDGVANMLGGFFELIAGNWLVAAGLLVLLYLVIRLAPLFGREKICWRCKGKGYRKAMLGGVNTCGTCGGRGIRLRAGVR